MLTRIAVLVLAALWLLDTASRRFPGRGVVVWREALSPGTAPLLPTSERFRHHGVDVRVDLAADRMILRLPLPTVLMTVVLFALPLLALVEGVEGWALYLLAPAMAGLQVGAFARITVPAARAEVRKRALRRLDPGEE